jgi:3-hydroxymyristoyl/3-hydroxydecanoyl-(acyl carrier protein) dehydratase
MNNLKENAVEAMIEFAARDEGELEAVWVFSPDLDLFRGHFPDRPLVPGILELEMVRVAMERFLSGTRLRILSIERAKFAREIKPGERIRLSAHFSTAGEKNRLSVKGILWVESEKAAQIQLTMEKDE